VSAPKNSDHSKPYESQLVNDIPSHKSLGVRVGEKIKILCGVLSAEMQQNGAFKSINWKYCNSKNCNEPNTWHWLAGINNESKIKVTTEGKWLQYYNKIQGFFFTFLLVFIQCALSHRTIESLCVGSSIEVNLKGPTCNNIPKRGWSDIINPQIRWFEPCPDEIPNYNQ